MPRRSYSNAWVEPASQEIVGMYLRLSSPREDVQIWREAFDAITSVGDFALTHLPNGRRFHLFVFTDKKDGIQFFD